jgi:hypothetical protein
LPDVADGMDTFCGLPIGHLAKKSNVDAKAIQIHLQVEFATFWLVDLFSWLM